jgi:hypothetical protein
MRESSFFLIVLAVAWGPSPAEAQETRYRVGAAARVGLLVGGASELLDGGFGMEGTGGLRLGRSPVWIRGDAGFLGRSENEPTPGGPAADNTLMTVVAGPEIEGRILLVALP